MKQKVCKNEKKTLFHVLLRTITNLQHRISKYSKIHHARTRAHTDTTHLVTKSYADLISHIDTLSNTDTCWNTSWVSA